MKKALSILSLALVLGIVGCAPTTDESTQPSTEPSIEESVTTEESTDPSTFQYRVKVEYDDGNPYVGARVQACTADNVSCFMPVTTDDNGECILNLELGEYIVHVLNVPEGYYYDEDGYRISETISSVTIVLIKDQVARHG